MVETIVYESKPHKRFEITRKQQEVPFGRCFLGELEEEATPHRIGVDCKGPYDGAGFFPFINL